jgi:hypothetical protein
MPLADILSLDGPLLSMALVQDSLLELRLVSREVMVALESNTGLKICIYVNDTCVGSPMVEFLQKWRGSVHFHCACPWNCESRWFKEVRDALISDQLRPLSLSLSVERNDLHSLGKALVGIRHAIRQVEITYSGYDTYLLAAAESIASLGHTLAMNISVQHDRGAGRTFMWLQHLLASSITIKSISFRSVRVST